VPIPAARRPALPPPPDRSRTGAGSGRAPLGPVTAAGTAAAPIPAPRRPALSPQPRWCRPRPRAAWPRLGAVTAPATGADSGRAPPGAAQLPRSCRPRRAGYGARRPAPGPALTPPLAPMPAARRLGQRRAASAAARRRRAEPSPGRAFPLRAAVTATAAARSPSALQMT
jgi:hypothetical protein